ncbi:cryptochrome-1 [Andrographis paniculata]|uniref:cryptochrome-1 n=1 Tax=Andrographis paniculata TaxID=175694 RepID=UPI0021E79741|nr:cryptochrome-1 [Andrographis paniculata]XP_051128138.1 cryptochrome-1 [Andrographis paniculata]XP_051128139.1 cryptochrome-1 [Andrographis paniculata]
MEKKCCTTVVWFRRDLRIEDNPALAAAARDGSVLPVFIWCPKEEGQYYPGRVSRWWMKQSLIHLQQSLKSLGAELVLIKTQSTLSALLDCITAVGATRVVYNHLYDPISLVRDHNIKQKLIELEIDVQGYNGELLFEPWEIRDDNDRAFTTFDAYWDKCLSMPKEPVSHLPPWRLLPTTGTVENTPIDALGLENESEKSSNALLGRGWSPGWSNADKAFNEFVEKHLFNYSKDRLRVGGNSTSLLSPYLHFGELSVRKVFQFVCLKQLVWKNEKNADREESAALFLKAVGLREYSRYICFNFPFTHEKSLLSSLKFFPWDVNQTNFKAWRQGRTGYPLVDAGMRELWATGWIHNRIRVIVSSFFVKFLLLPWQWGMKYFWDTLLDADLESDILGWQYISGSLPDGHELERMDSPQIQGFKFDPEGEYVRQWLPELARMPTEWIHHPWDAPPAVLKSAGVDLGVNYPKPIIDVDLARDKLTEAIAVMRGNEATERAANEEVFDNSDVNPKVVVKEKGLGPVSSSLDQRVPSMRNLENVVPNKKRSKSREDDRPARDNLCNNGKGVSKMDDDDLCSTAESSSTKKQTTSSRISFSVPQNCSSMSTDAPFRVLDSSDLELRWQDEIGAEETTSKNGATNLQVYGKQNIGEDESPSSNL